ncbi:hypothetical protein HMPREF0973_00357 [Prevotella veroralis F0319]|uniref:Uncharacterized protein n=1 Tax=Prevotella veroralis F0319 TaxID=649761 RepID=C9ML82_9BACT|nr:hypothetical protein HMPREF0973_00357 [Prevotella veroralis F0319]
MRTDEGVCPYFKDVIRKILPPSLSILIRLMASINGAFLMLFQL